MRHLLLFEELHRRPGLGGTQLERELYELVRDYKVNPLSSDYSQVRDIKMDLKKRPELVAYSQAAVRAAYGERFAVYRGCPHDACTNSDAGWSTDMPTALGFAAGYGGELLVGYVDAENVVYFDGAISHLRGVALGEEEVIVNDYRAIEQIGSVNVGGYESYLEPEERYEHLGYPSAELETQVEAEVKAICAKNLL